MLLILIYGKRIKENKMKFNLFFTFLYYVDVTITHCYRVTLGQQFYCLLCDPLAFITKVYSTRKIHTEF